MNSQSVAASDLNLKTAMNIAHNNAYYRLISYFFNKKHLMNFENKTSIFETYF